MPAAEIWMGQEIVHLRRFSAILRSASKLIGQDDYLANLLLEDALDELQCVLVSDQANQRNRERILGIMNSGAEKTLAPQHPLVARGPRTAPGAELTINEFVRSLLASGRWAQARQIRSSRAPRRPIGLE